LLKYSATMSLLGTRLLSSKYDVGFAAVSVSVTSLGRTSIVRLPVRHQRGRRIQVFLRLCELSWDDGSKEEGQRELHQSWTYAAHQGRKDEVGTAIYSFGFIYLMFVYLFISLFVCLIVCFSSIERVWRSLPPSWRKRSGLALWLPNTCPLIPWTKSEEGH
jgi:hypothetical protein